MTRPTQWFLLALLGAASGMLFVQKRTRDSKNSRADAIVAAETRATTRKTRSDVPRSQVTVLRTSESIPSNPEHPDYDPSLFIKVHGGDAKELFDLEPRKAAWAEPMEEQVSSYVAKSFADLEVDAQLEVECHTASCEIRADLSELDEKEAEVVEAYLSYAAPIGSFAQSSWGEPGHLTIISMLPPELRTYEKLAEFIADFAAAETTAETRATLLEELAIHRSARP